VRTSETAGNDTILGGCSVFPEGIELTRNILENKILDGIALEQTIRMIRTA
jgi:hypothetical protein